jgi:hypothetical protein
MADQRVQLPIKIVDPTTATQEATVNASGQLAVAGPVTNAGTFAVQVDGAALTALQLIDDTVVVDDAAFTPGTTKVSMVGFEFDDSGTDSVDEGDGGAARMSANRNIYMRIRDNAGNERGANVNASSQLEVSVGNTSLTVAGAAADGAAVSGNPVRVAGKDGSGNTQDLATDTSGVLSVNVLTGGGVDTPTTPLQSSVTSSALAAGSSVNVDSADLVSKYLWQADLTSSVAFKVVLSTLANGVATVRSTMFGRGGETIQWRPPHRAFSQSGSGAGADGFRAAFTNLDTSEAADVYATFHYADN